MNDNPLRPFDSAARLAGLVLIILGSLALLFGLAVFAFAGAYPSMMADPAMHDRLEELQRNSPFTLKTLLLITGAVFCTYGVAAAITGPFIRRGSRVAMILGLILAIVVALVSLLNVISALLVQRAADAIMPVGLTAIHAWLVKLLIEALRQSPAASAVYFPTPAPYQPMQAYYQPPTAPTAR